MRYNELLAHNLRLLRTFHRISAVQLSEDLHMHTNRIGYMENPTNINIKAEEIEAICNYFKVSYDDLLYKKAELVFK